MGGMTDSPLPALSLDDHALLLDAIDSHEYWQIGAAQRRKDGMVWIPGGCVDPIDPYWQLREPTAVEAETIQAIQTSASSRRSRARLTRDRRQGSRSSIGCHQFVSRTSENDSIRAGSGRDGAGRQLQGTPDRTR